MMYLAEDELKLLKLHVRIWAWLYKYPNNTVEDFPELTRNCRCTLESPKVPHPIRNGNIFCELYGNFASIYDVDHCLRCPLTCYALYALVDRFHQSEDVTTRKKIAHTLLNAGKERLIATVRYMHHLKKGE